MNKKFIVITFSSMVLTSILTSIITKNKIEKNIEKDLLPLGKLNIATFDNETMANMYLELNDNYNDSIKELKKRKYAVFEIRIIEKPSNGGTKIIA